MNRIITITGTESTGKTVLAEHLSTHFGFPLVADVSRSYVDDIGRDYTEEDVIIIAQKIIEQEDLAIKKSNGLIVSDNDLINIKIWLHYYNWKTPNWLDEAIQNRESALYLLCDIDLPWVKDEQRQNEHDRYNLLERFKEEMTVYNKDFSLIQGTDDQRLSSAVKTIDTNLLAGK